MNTHTIMSTKCEEDDIWAIVMQYMNDDLKGNKKLKKAWQRIQSPPMMKIPLGAHKQCVECKRIQAKTSATQFANGTRYLTYVNCYECYWFNNKMAEYILGIEAEEEEPKKYETNRKKRKI